MRVVGLFLLGVLLASAGREAAAQTAVYRWVDERGIPHYAQTPDAVPERYRAGAVRLDLAPAPAPAAAEEAARETVIRFTPGRHIVVEAHVNGTVPARLILDTGAAQTLLSPRVLAAAGVSRAQGARPGRTRGLARDVEVEVERAAVETLAVGRARVDHLVVGVYDLGLPDLDGLLGQDFLSRFHVAIDPDAGVVRLVPRP
jgi:aspartyl protease family protein